MAGRFLCIGLVWMRLALLAAAADLPPVRVAVIGDEASRELSTLVAAELTRVGSVELVEREELAKVGDELKLRTMATGQPLELGKLLRADGLVFIGRGPSQTTVKFTGVDLGYVLFDARIAPGGDPSEQARLIVHRIEGYSAKLRLGTARGVPLSVLDLRCEVGGARTAALERDLTLLLESRLSAVPEYVVLERRHAGALGFERSLDSKAPLLPLGGWLIDGTFGPPSPGAGDLTVRLRLRGPSAEPAGLEIAGRADDLPDLAGKLVTAIQRATGRPSDLPAWQPEKEAHEYLLEAIWGWQHNALDAALEAAESAELLGETAADLTAVKSNLLAARARRGLDMSDPIARRPPFAGGPSLDERTDDTLAALRETARYADGKLEAKLRWLDPAREPDAQMGRLELSVVRLGSVLVAYLDKLGSPRADELRLALRLVTHYDPLHGKVGAALQESGGNLRDKFADQWAASLEEELAYHRLLLTSTDQFFPGALINGRWNEFCPRFLPTAEAQRAAYMHLVEELKRDPAGRLAVLLIASCSPDGAVADAAYKAWLDELWTRRDLLVADQPRRYEWTNSRAVPDAVRLRHAADAVPLLRYYLSHRHGFPDWNYCVEAMWQPEGWSEAEAAAIWADYRAFCARAGRERFDIALEERLFKKFPALAAPAPPDAPTLPVTRYWHPPQPPSRPAVRYGVFPRAVAGDSLFVFAAPEGTFESLIYRVISPGLAAEAIAPPEQMNPIRLSATATGLCVDYYPVSVHSHGNPPHRVAVYDRKTRAWATHEVAVPFMHHFTAGGSFYLNLLGGGGDKWENGLARYDLDTGRSVALASSRRNPPRNQFDNRTDSQFLEVFAGPGGRPCANTTLGVCYLREEAGDWPPVFDACAGVASVTGEGGTLVYGSGEVVRLDPARSASEYLLAPAAPHYRRVSDGKRPAVKELTPWLEQARWRTPQECELHSGSIGWHDGRLFLLLPPAPHTRNCELLIYGRDAGRPPQRIPLTFHLDDATRAQLAPTFNDPARQPWAWTPETLEHPDARFGRLGLLASSAGLWLTATEGGEWFIPYEDIDRFTEGAKTR